MVAQALALHLALLGPAAAPWVHVLPPLELPASLPALADAAPVSQTNARPAGGATRGDPSDAAAVTGDAATERPADAAPLVVRTEPRRGNVLAGYGGALAGTAASDFVFVGLVAIGIAGWVEGGGLFGGDGNSGWATLTLAGATGFVFVTPAVMVWGAQKTTGRRAPGAAYAVAFALRLAGFLLAQSVPAIALVTELVAAPLAVGAIVANGSPVEQRAAPPPDFPDEPVPLPGPAGPRISRPLCPDAALALR